MTRLPNIWRAAASILVFAGLGSSLALAADLDEVRTRLTQDIEAAQTGLGSAQASISRERGQLAGQINSAQNRVLDLRERAVSARRLADEETLSLAQIEARLDTWREQSLFQSRLLAGFLNRSGQRSQANVSEMNLQDDLQLFSGYLAQQDERLYPGWKLQELVLPGGQVTPVEVLQLGPVQWFWQEGQGQAGLASAEGNMTRVALLFESAAASGLQSLRENGSGNITFDPTLTHALLLAEDEETFMEHLQKGGIWVIPIMLFALFASIISGFKAVWLYRLPPQLPALAERAEAAIREGSGAVQALLRQAHGAQAELLKIALAAPQTAGQRDDRLYATLLEQRNALERWLGAIAMTASISPLLGLLGTVSGMITTFKLMTLFGSGDASSVSAGISEALITTELGLVVAIPALLSHALMTRKVKSYFARLENAAVQLSQLPLTRD